MKNKPALIILNGKEFNKKEFLNSLSDDRLVIAADGGIKYLGGLDVPPLIHIGDMDSSVPGSKVPIKDTIIFPAEKNFSDFHLALEYAQKKKVSEVFVFAACGGRSDHFISNYDTAVDFASKGMKIVFSGSNEDIFFLPRALKEYVFDFKKGSTVSMFSGSESVEDLTVSGFKYPAVKLDLKRSVPVGLSNVCTNINKQKIRFDNGVLVLIYNKSKV